MIRNFYHTQKQTQASSHNGTGPVDVYEIWAKTDFETNVDFVDRMVIPPGTTIGYHQHAQNEEMYILLNGQGTMTIDGETVSVTKGDMVLNPASGSHGLHNDSDEDIDLLVIQVSLVA